MQELTQLYTIYDKTAERSGPLFQAVNDGVAIRNTVLILKDTLFPEDYVLYRIGIYDTALPSVTLEPTPVVVDYIISFYDYQEKLKEGKK